jgi:putative ABC transport system permease protein
MNYMINANMGFDRDLVYNIRLQGNEFNKVKNYYSQFPEVSNIAGVGHVAGVGNLDGVEIRLQMEHEKMDIHQFEIDENYIDVMGLELIAGKNFPENLSSETESFIIIDERTVKALHFETPQNAIGKNIIVGDSILVEVIGVVKDYTYAAMFLPERPLVLRYLPKNFRVAVLRIEAGNSPTLISKLETEWEKIDKYNKFRGEFLDDEIKEYYSYFEDITYTVGFTSILAIVIACLGLLGMITYSTQTKIKEIGIRKVYGAESKNIIYLVSKTYIKLFIIAAFIAGPLAYLINNMWLQYVSNHTPFGFGIILTGIFIIIIFGMLTIASQTLKAANTNPAQTLRYE